MGGSFGSCMVASGMAGASDCAALATPGQRRDGDRQSPSPLSHGRIAEGLRAGSRHRPTTIDRVTWIMAPSVASIEAMTGARYLRTSTSIFPRRWARGIRRRAVTTGEMGHLRSSFFRSRCPLPAAHVPDDGGAPAEPGEEPRAVGRERHHAGPAVAGLECEHLLAGLDVIQADRVLAEVTARTGRPRSPACGRRGRA